MSATVPDDRQSASDGSTSRSGEPPAEVSLEDDEVFHLLQARRRRLVLRYLRGRDGPEAMRDVAEQVAAWEHGTTLAALTSAERQRVYIALYQTHLPKLDEAGVIEYNQSRGVVDPTDRIDQLYDVLDFEDAVEEAVGAAGPDAGVARAGRDPMAVYGSASLASTGLVTAAWVGTIALPGVIVATVVTALFALLTVGVGVGE